MKKSSATFLQGVTVLIGIGALVFLLWEPHIEGRNVDATLFEIYFKDPFLAYAYGASLFFFMALYQAYQALGFVRQGKTHSEETLKSLKSIKYCCITFASLVAAAVAYLIMANSGSDDIAGGVAMGLFMTIGSLMMATAAALLQKRLRARST